MNDEQIRELEKEAKQAADAAESPERQVLITKPEAMMLATTPIEERVRELGVMRHTERLPRSERLKRGISFRDGYEYAMAMHQIPAIEENEKPKDTGIAQQAPAPSEVQPSMDEVKA
jgi:hypothetical protein